MSDEEAALSIPLSPLMGETDRERLLSPESPKFSLLGNDAKKSSWPSENSSRNPGPYSPLLTPKERDSLFSLGKSSTLDERKEEIRSQHTGDAEEERQRIIPPVIAPSNSNLSENDEKEKTPRESLRNRLRKMNGSKNRTGSLSKHNSPEKHNSKLDPEMMVLDEEYELDKPPPNSLKRLRRAGGLRERSRRRLRRSMSESNLALRLHFKPGGSTDSENEKRLNSKLFGKIAQLKSRIKEIETRREEETDVLNQHIESLTKARGEHKNTIDLLMKEVSLGEGEESGILGKPLMNKSDLFNAGSNRKGDEAALQPDGELLKDDKGERHEELEMKKLQEKLDNANSQVDQLSRKLSHHRKESQMLYNQIHPTEESKVNLEHMKSKIADLQERNSTLEESIQGEVMLMKAIETLEKQVEETRDTNSLLRRQLDEQASSHSAVIKNMKEKLKDKVELEQRLRFLEDQLVQYTKETPWSETRAHIDTRTSTLNVKPYPSKAMQMSRELNSGLEMFGTITPPHSRDIEVPDSIKKLRQENKPNETLIRKLSASLAEVQEASVDKIDERSAQIISSDFKNALASQLAHNKKERISRSNSAPISPEKQRKNSQDTDAAVLAVLTRIEVLARVEDLMTVEIERIRKEMRAKTETLENKNKEVAELERKLQAAESNKDGTIEDLEELIRQSGISLNELQEKSDQEIKCLREELSAKDDTFNEERKQLEDGLNNLRQKSSKLEQQFNKLKNDSLQVKEKVAELENELDIARVEASAATESKVQVIQLLAAEMERLKNNHGCFVTIRKNVHPVSEPRSKEGKGTAHYTARV